MAIQLNDRDQLIFKMIDEHQVLLEKHIAWFISEDDKPVLIRDRLRKLFYLDYLLCERHGTKLPWWTTPTKPLVYMLSPMSRTSSNSEATDLDLFDANVQRHFLEVANVRMLSLISQTEGDLSELNWKTARATLCQGHLDSVMSFVAGSQKYNVGIINHPSNKLELVANLEKAFSEEAVGLVMVISRDEAHQKQLQEHVNAAKVSFDLLNVIFITHHELYKAGITKACWVNSSSERANFFQPAAVYHNSFGSPSSVSA